MAEDKTESDEDVYKDSADLLEDDEIEADEEGFMKGYEEAGESDEEEDAEEESDEE